MILLSYNDNLFCQMLRFQSDPIYLGYVRIRLWRVIIFRLGSTWSVQSSYHGAVAYF